MMRKLLAALVLGGLCTVAVPAQASGGTVFRLTVPGIRADSSATQTGSSGQPSVPSATIVANGASRNWSDGTYASSCLGYLSSGTTAYLYSGATGDGVYRINPGGTIMDVWCDMTADGGGWALVMRGYAGDGGTAASWATTSAVNPTRGTVANAPQGTLSFKYSDATINLIRSSGVGNYRTKDDGTYSNTRFWQSATYGHLTPPSGYAITSYATTSWTGANSGSSFATTAVQGGLGDDNGSGSIFVDTSRSSIYRWLDNSGSTSTAYCTDQQSGCNFTMWVR